MLVILCCYFNNDRMHLKGSLFTTAPRLLDKSSEGSAQHLRSLSQLPYLHHPCFNQAASSLNWTEAMHPCLFSKCLPTATSPDLSPHLSFCHYLSGRAGVLTAPCCSPFSGTTCEWSGPDSPRHLRSACAPPHCTHTTFLIHLRFHLSHCLVTIYLLIYSPNRLRGQKGQHVFFFFYLSSRS